jgi:hypothetical protein
MKAKRAKSAFLNEFKKEIKKIKTPEVIGPKIGMRFKNPEIKLKERAYSILKTFRDKKVKIKTKRQLKILLPNQAETFSWQFLKTSKNLSSFSLGEKNLIILSPIPFSREMKTERKNKVNVEKIPPKMAKIAEKMLFEALINQSWKVFKRFSKFSEAKIPKFFKVGEIFSKYSGIDLTNFWDSEKIGETKKKIKTPKKEKMER